MNIIDFSWDRPGASNIVSAGYSGVLRYLSSDTTGKTINEPELQEYRNAGLDVGFFWEDAADAALGGHTQGVTDATKALAQANALGIPESVPIYFAVDFDINDAQKPIAGQYMQGAASIIGATRVATYGGYWWIKYASENNLSIKFCQTLAWSGGQVHPAADLYQNGQQAFNGGADIDEVKQTNWGQWPSSVNPQPHPEPPTPTPSPSVTTYTVVSGDTLSGIGDKLGIDWHQIAALNNIQPPYTIYPGQILRISGAPTPPNGQTYTVTSGDTLSGIAAKFGISLTALEAANPQITDPNLIYPGEVLRIPGGNAPTPAPAPTSYYYTIISGDTLTKIANQFGTTINQLLTWNQGKYSNMTANFIEAGWSIRVR